MNKKYESILEPYTFKNGISMRNPIVMAPMTNYASQENGEVTEAELAYYKERAGGVGAVITAVAYVTPNGQGFPNEVSAATDDMVPSLTRLADTIKGEGAKAILQIFHAGRMAPVDVVEDPVSASAVKADRPKLTTPRELTEAEITEIIEAFGEAARRAIEAGFDGVEIHGANTYLIQQFFSPQTNRRTDKWGGSFEKRMAFPLAVIDTVKKSVKKHTEEPFIIGYRLSPEEPWQPGITMEDTLAYAEVLSEQNLDYLSISLQDFWQGSIRDKGDKTARVQLIHDKVGHKLPIMGVGSLHTPDEVVEALGSGVPLIALGRELIMEPKWIEKIKNGEEKTIATTMSRNDQERLVVTDKLWQAATTVKGWFPVID